MGGEIRPPAIFYILPNKKRKGGEEKMVTYEKLTKRIERAKVQKDKFEANTISEHYWLGYIQCAQDLRNDVNSK